MANSKEVTDFLNEIRDLRIQTGIREEISAGLKPIAEDLAKDMRQEAASTANPGEHTGKLVASIRVEPGRRGAGATVQYLVRAGGETTTVDGYDYVNAKEFGTSRQQAEPFFFSTYRRKKLEIDRKIVSVVERAINTGKVFRK
jgi:HK97 gp10 family phage protein